MGQNFSSIRASTLVKISHRSQPFTNQKTAALKAFNRNASSVSGGLCRYNGVKGVSLKYWRVSGVYVCPFKMAVYSHKKFDPGNSMQYSVGIP